MAACGLLLLPVCALAGWAVAPIRVELSAQSRVETVTVSNDGDVPVQFDVEARRWSQGSAGTDEYEATDELVVFPRMLNVPPRESRIVRIAIKAPAGPVERTYRVFIREKARERTAQGSNVSILVNFGVPVFSRPAQPQPAAHIVELAARDGALTATLHNAGNVHLQFRAMTVRGYNAAGDELFDTQAAAGYLLAGCRRDFHLPLPAAACPELTRVTVSFLSDTLELEQSTGADDAICPR